MADSAKTLTVITETGAFHLTGRPYELSSFSHVPTSRLTVPKERNVFNSSKKNIYPGSRFDRLFKNVEGYDNKIHRDDREHAKSRGLAVHDEEIRKAVPTLSSSIYGHGHRLQHPIDCLDRKHVRIGIVQSEFYRRNGCQIQP